MPHDFSTSQGLKHLHEAVNYAYEQMKSFRRMREIFQEANRGHHYKNQDANPRRVREPVNPLNQFVTTLERTLVQAQPSARVGGEMSLREAKARQEYLNRRIKELNVFKVLRTAVRETLTGYIGIAKCGIAPGASVDIEGVPHERGESYVQNIPLNRWFWDMQPDDHSDADFMGHMYDRKVDDLAINPMYDAKVVRAITDKGRRLTDLDREGPSGEQKEYQFPLFDRVALREVYIPSQGIIVTYSPSHLDKPLRVASIDAPEWGPYLFLVFEDTGLIMPNAPAGHLLDTHDFVNLMYRKIFARANRLKEKNLFEGGSDDDAERMRMAPDGAWIRVDNLAGIRKDVTGGVDPLMMATAMHGRQLFDEMSGMVRVMGGVNPSVDTATEVNRLNANVSRMARHMQEETLKFGGQILKTLAWYEETDPLREQVVRTQIGKGGKAIHSTWTPEIREGDRVEHDVDIVPDSLALRSSEEQFEQLMQVVERIVYPGFQLPTEGEIALKLPELLAEAALRKNIPELSRVVDYATDESLVRAGAGGSPNAPRGGQSNGNGVRGPRPRSNEDAAIQQFMNAGAARRSELEAV